MKGIITKITGGLCLGMVLSPLVGCTSYRQIVDPCWPDRYNAQARDSVRAMAFAQTEKGHILDQTVWNWMFEADSKTGIGTDRLTEAGLEHLRYISRRLPVPDTHVFLQRAQDIPYVTGMAPEQLLQQRNDLNNRRIEAIQRFLSTQSVPLPANYQVAVHDFAPPGMPARVIVGTQIVPVPIQGAQQKIENNYQGKIQAYSTAGSGGGVPQ